MSILELQRRLVEVGRVRMGEKKPTNNGGSRPAKLTHWRLTSKDKQRLDAAAAIYGGTVQAWEDQHELYTESDALDIAIIPGQALSQFYELWGRPGPKKPVVCLRRCDGSTELLGDTPCPCMIEMQDPTVARACTPTTRLLVLLRKVTGIGAWRLDTHGWYAASELAGTAEMLEMLTATRMPVNARLRLEQRSVQRGDDLRRFVVPVIDIDATLDQTMAALSGGRMLALDPPPVEVIDAAREAFERRGDTGDRPDRDQQAPPNPPFTPVPAELTAPPAPSMRDQLASAHKPPPSTPRANAATPIPPTGLTHRPATEHQASPPEDGQAADPESAPAATARAAGEVPGSAAPARVSQQDAEAIARMCREAGVPRAAFLAAFSANLDGPMFSSARDVPVDVMPALRARLLDIFYGRATLWVDPDTASVRLVDHNDDTGQPITLPSAAYWDARLQHVKGVGPAKLLRTARKIAGNHELPLPATVADIPDHQQLRVELNRWLLEHVDAA